MKEAEIAEYDEEGAAVRYSIVEGGVVGTRAGSKSRGHGAEYRKKQLVDDMLRYFDNKRESERFVRYFFEDMCGVIASHERSDFIRLGDFVCEDREGRQGAAMEKRGREVGVKRRVNLKIYLWLRKQLRGQKNLKHNICRK